MKWIAIIAVVATLVCSANAQPTPNLDQFHQADDDKRPVDIKRNTSGESNEGSEREHTNTQLPFSPP